MPHIDLPEGVPGIRSALMFRPETAAPLGQLAEVLLRGENTLTRGERELELRRRQEPALDEERPEQAPGKAVVVHGVCYRHAAACS